MTVGTGRFEASARVGSWVAVVALGAWAGCSERLGQGQPTPGRDAGAPQNPVPTPGHELPVCLGDVACACETDLSALVQWLEAQPAARPELPLRRIQGEVLLADHRPAAGARVWVVSLATRAVQPLRADDSGLFEVSAPEGPLAAVGAADGLLPDVTRVTAPGPVALQLKPAISFDYRGAVYEAGRPAAGVRVSLAEKWCSRRDAVTDANGQFMFPGLATGAWQLRAERGGQVAARFQHLGATTGLIGLELAAPLPVEGQVRDATGSPLPGAKIRAPELDAGAVADEKGHYALRLPPGSARLEATLPGLLPSERQAYVEARGLTEENFTLVPEVVVRGSVEGPDGALAGAKLWLRDRKSRYSPPENRDTGVVSRSDGTFELKLPKQRCEIGATHGELEPGYLEWVPEQPGPLRLALRASKKLSGRVVDSDGIAHAGAVIELLEGRSHAEPVEAKAREDGSFEVEPSGDGPWTLKARVDVRTALFRTVLFATLSVAQGAARQELRLVATAPVLAVEGTVRDATGRPLKGAWVGLDPVGGEALPGRDDPRGSVVLFSPGHGPAVPVYRGTRHMVRSGDDGSFRIAGLTRGAYLAVADHPDFGPGGRKPLRVRAGQSGVKLVLTPKPRLTGRVLGQSGPLSRFAVGHVDHTQGERGFELVFDQAGPVDLLFEAAGHAPLARRFELEFGKVLRAGELVLGPASP